MESFDLEFGPGPVRLPLCCSPCSKYGLPSNMMALITSSAAVLLPCPQPIRHCLPCAVPLVCLAFCVCSAACPCSRCSAFLLYPVRSNDRPPDCHSAAPPSIFIRCFNMDGEGMSAEWRWFFVPLPPT